MTFVPGTAVGSAPAAVVGAASGALGAKVGDGDVLADGDAIGSGDVVGPGGNNVGETGTADG
ncbi:MAG: hypothetical protein M3R44_03160 [Candidatus Eremiobacteraeota bacterium]|nr:hypothetical protein [Candidatus Eremiobacteraeota bacterium]